MKQKYIHLLAAVLIFLPVLGLAHEVKTTGTLDILLHRDPEDNPIAREPAQLYFSVTDSQEKFKFADCECRVAISLGEQVLVDRFLTAADEAPDWGVNVSRVDYTFPRRGLYVVSIEGQSKAGFYPDFKLDYDVRVERESITVPAQPDQDNGGTIRNYFIIGGVVIVFGIITYTVFLKKRKKK